MAGSLQRTVRNKVLAMKIIMNKKDIFICKLKGHIPRQFYNTPIDGAASKYANV
jgi:hypothetical protein